MLTTITRYISIIQIDNPTHICHSIIKLILKNTVIFWVIHHDHMSMVNLSKCIRLLFIRDCCIWKLCSNGINIAKIFTGSIMDNHVDIIILYRFNDSSFLTIQIICILLLSEIPHKISENKRGGIPQPSEFSLNIWSQYIVHISVFGTCSDFRSIYGRRRFVYYPVLQHS